MSIPEILCTWIVYPKGLVWRAVSPSTHNIMYVCVNFFLVYKFLGRYIKAYWSKMKIRDTVISEEQERMLLERILSEEENERDDVSGHVTIM